MHLPVRPPRSFKPGPTTALFRNNCRHARPHRSTIGGRKTRQFNYDRNQQCEDREQNAPQTSLAVISAPSNRASAGHCRQCHGTATASASSVKFSAWENMGQVDFVHRPVVQQCPCDLPVAEDACGHQRRQARGPGT